MPKSKFRPSRFFQKRKTKKSSTAQVRFHRFMKLPILALIFLVIAGVVYAYFTGQAASSDLVFHTGSLKISLTDPSKLSFTGLKPGDEQVVEYQVKNTGSMPIYLKGKFVGGWVDSNLDNEKLKPVKLEYHLDQGEWQTLMTDGPSIGAEYFYSTDNSETNLISLEPDQTMSWRATFKLAADVDNDYQDQQYQVSIHLAAKQAEDGASWPENY